MEAETRYARSGELWHRLPGASATARSTSSGRPATCRTSSRTSGPGLRTRAFLERMASFSRLILFDRRGTGLSDRTSRSARSRRCSTTSGPCSMPPASERAALFGGAEGGPMCALFAATHPGADVGARARRLVRRDGSGHRTTRGVSTTKLRSASSRPTTPAGAPTTSASARLAPLTRRATSGSGSGTRRPVASPARPARPGPGSTSRWRSTSVTCSPRSACPTLVVHRSGDRVIPVEAGRYLAEHIPDAKFVELAGIDHYPFAGDGDASARRGRGVPHRLAASRVSPIACSRRCSSPTSSARRSAPPSSATGAGPSSSPSITGSCGRELERHRGKVVRVEGDGTLSTFDGPARAVSCAAAIRRRARAARRGDPRRPAHGRDRARRDGRRRHRRPHRRARRITRRGGGSARVEHRQGPRRRLRDRVRRPRAGTSSKACPASGRSTQSTPPDQADAVRTARVPSARARACLRAHELDGPGEHLAEDPGDLVELGLTRDERRRDLDAPGRRGRRRGRSGPASHSAFER